MADKERKTGNGRFCPWCGDPIKDHPFLGAKNTYRSRFCDLTPVVDRKKSDGSGTIITQASEDVIQRTEENNLRLVHTRTLVR